MKIELPDERIIAMLGFHPSTPIAEAIGMFMRNRTLNKDVVFHRIGEMALEKFVDDNLSR